MLSGLRRILSSPNFLQSSIPLESVHYVSTLTHYARLFRPLFFLYTTEIYYSSCLYRLLLTSKRFHKYFISRVKYLCTLVPVLSNLAQANMSISDFRRKKLKYVFNVFFDVNHSGNIDRKDFEIAIQQVCTMRGWNESSSNFKQIKDRMMAIWDGLQQSADDDQDGQISLDEWCSMWEAFARNPENASEWQNSYMDLMFDIIDTSGDGCIDENEFCAVCDHYGISRQESSAAYKKFSNSGAVNVTRPVFHSYWREYFSSDDENAPGNFIFGKISFD
ncbi:calexcitin-2 [Planococcus citri]|uniref:calexcitin-2 n=1 Tax=Planococcus citri TaxID=170843 RepID=UPI0031F84364